jgi:predicted amidohydrolase YtcJ
MTRDTADLLLTGGRVWAHHGAPITDGALDAVAVGGGRILATGPAAELRERCDAQTTIIDVGGRRIVPGLVDSHIHAIRAGLTYRQELDWTGVTSVRQALGTVRAAAGRRPAGAWITALGGWHPAQFTERRLPSPAELDQAAPDHPVFIHPVYGHDDHGALNAAALAALGWTGTCPDPPGGRLHRRPDGRPDGRLSGVGGYQAVTAVALRPSPAQAAESTQAFFGRLAALGLTGVIDAGGLGMGPDQYHAIRSVWRRGALPLRVRMNLGATTPGAEPQQIAAWRAYTGPGVGDGILSVLGLGEVMHLGCHDWEGMTELEITDGAYREFVQQAREAAVAGWPMTVHAILDSSIGRILDAIAEVDAEIPVRGLRWSLCHAECISPANLRRVRDLGLALALQSRLVHKAGVCAERWGEDTVRHGPPLGDILRLGIPFGAGTDATRAASYHPWRALWWFVTGQSLDGGPRRDAAHRLDRATALHAYTRGSTWLSFEDTSRGLLIPGACADLAVLSGDYFTVPEDDIPAITADLTVVDGRVVHAAGAFAGVRVRHHPPRPAPDPPAGPTVPPALSAAAPSAAVPAPAGPGEPG